MDIGIGLPNSLAGVGGRRLVDWARAAEGRGFSVLGTIGRIAYDTHEELIALAAAAAVTERIHLMPTVLVAPPRQAVLLAKQAATLDAVSEGRFRLGLGIGGRDDDYLALGVDPTGKGDALEEVVATCRSVWAGERPEGAELPVGPHPAHLPIVLGGFSEPAFRRAGRIADGFVAGPMPPDAIAGAARVVAEEAEKAGRPAPTLYAATYVALGDDVRDEADRNVASYYAFDPQMVEVLTENLLRTPDDVARTRDALAEVGVEELCLWPEAAGLEQVDRIADAAGL
jgi:alkanesulfonate monooxygenase SsuD/methylene tetrahydromethanopterin reductase-like flavin-dependent oxidoreductase (luciferase family)